MKKSMRVNQYFFQIIIIEAYCMNFNGYNISGHPPVDGHFNRFTYPIPPNNQYFSNYNARLQILRQQYYYERQYTQMNPYYYFYNGLKSSQAPNPANISQFPTNTTLFTHQSHNQHSMKMNPSHENLNFEMDKTPISCNKTSPQNGSNNLFQKHLSKNLIQKPQLSSYSTIKKRRQHEFSNPKSTPKKDIEDIDCQIITPAEYCCSNENLKSGNHPSSFIIHSSTNQKQDHSPSPSHQKLIIKIKRIKKQKSTKDIPQSRRPSHKTNKLKDPHYANQYKPIAFQKPILENSQYSIKKCEKLEFIKQSLIKRNTTFCTDQFQIFLDYPFFKKLQQIELLILYAFINSHQQDYFNVSNMQSIVKQVRKFALQYPSSKTSKPSQI